MNTYLKKKNNSTLRKLRSWNTVSVHFMENKWGKSGNSDSIFLGSKITAYGECSHEIWRHLLLRRKAMTKLDSILKSRDITLLPKVYLVKAMVFPVVIYRCESWTIKKSECRRIDAFEMWCWRRLLGVPWTTKRSNQSILKETSPEYSLERLILKLKLLYFVKSRLTGKDPGAGKDWKQEQKGWQKLRWLDGVTNSMDMSLSKLQDIVKDRDVCVLQSMVSQRAGYDLGTKQQQQNKVTKQERNASNATKLMYEFSTKLIKYY